MNYTSIIFDLFDVLVTIDWEYFLNQDLTLKPKAIEFFRSSLWHDYKKGLVSHETILTTSAHISPVLKNLIETLPHHIQVIPDMIKLINTLKTKNYHVYLLTNVSTNTFSVLEKKYSFTNLFNGIMTSFMAQAIKPEPLIYTKFLTTYNLQAHECLLIDDHEKNINTGEQLGITGITHKNYQETLNTLKNLRVLDKN
jgi:putative hydrolase of the HAD superfamily